MADNGNEDVGESCGLFMQSSNPTLIHVTVNDNTAGGMVLLLSNPTITNLTVSGNIGTGIYMFYSSPTITYATISDNGLDYESDLFTYGGGIRMEDNSNMALTHATISDNSSYHGGGGISSYQSDTIILQDVIVSGHFVEGGTGFDHAGGGIKSTDTKLILADVIVTGNSTSSSGGGISIGGDYLKMNNVTISDNYSGGNGGGMDSNAPIIMTNCTITGNTAEWNGSGINMGPETNQIIVNSIINNNSSDEDLHFTGGDFYTPDISYCNIGGAYSGEGSEPSDVGGDDDVVELPEFAVERRRFRVGDVQEGEDSTGLQLLDECSFVD